MLALPLLVLSTYSPSLPVFANLPHSLLSPTQVMILYSLQGRSTSSFCFQQSQIFLKEFQDKINGLIASVEDVLVSKTVEKDREMNLAVFERKELEKRN